MPPILKTGLAPLALVALGLTTAPPAPAQELIYTLNNVTFDDGGEAFGFFDYNPSTHLLSDYDLGTTTGSTAFGSSYNPKTASPFLITNHTFEFLTNDGSHLLALFTTATIASPGVYSLYPGTLVAKNELSGSGELTPTGDRVVVDGTTQKVIRGFAASGVPAGPSLVVTLAPAAVPEASTTVSFGMLLVLGLGGVVIAAKRKKASAPSA